MALSSPPATGLRPSVQPLTGASEDYGKLLELIGDARIVLLGEASHGTHEFYRERATITRRLILEKGFQAVAVEADWPDAYRVNRWIRCVGDDRTGRDALGDFQRFPRWMWRNADVLTFLEWLRRHNESLTPEQRGGVFRLRPLFFFLSFEGGGRRFSGGGPPAPRTGTHPPR